MHYYVCTILNIYITASPAFNVHTPLLHVYCLEIVML